MMIQLIIKMILMVFQLIIMFRRNHANDDELKMIMKETRLHSRTGRLPSRPDQSSASRPWVADYYPESTSRRDLFLFCILKSQTGFRQPRLLVAPCHCGQRWWTWGSAWPARWSSSTSSKKISAPFSRRSPYSWSLSRWSLQLVSLPRESTNPPPELPLAADFIDSFSARSTARPCKVHNAKCKIAKWQVQNSKWKV